jgi:hypothetical protein
MESAVFKARKAEDNYVVSTKPSLPDLPKHLYASELGQARLKLESAGDKKLAALVAETANREAALEMRFPEAFASVDGAVKGRNATRQALNDDPEFNKRNRAIVDAGKAVKTYEEKALPELPDLAAASKIYLDQLK